MDSVKRYISSNFTKTFLTIFLPFYLIISLIYLVKISALTAQIKLSFGELLTLYSYSIPDIVFYTLPLSFVAALANVLVKLSQDNELIALYALGLKADKVLKNLWILALLFSLLLLSISFLAMPMSKQFYKAFKESKKNEAKLNITAGKLGQKFGNYYIYVKKEENGKFKDIVIYNRTQKDKEQFFSSKHGRINHNHGTTSLFLKEGYGYTYQKENLQQAQYKTLEVFDRSPKTSFRFQDVIDYWAQMKTNMKILHRGLFFIFVSLIPLLSLYLVASFTMINPRYQANRAFLVILATALLLYMIASLLEKSGNIYWLISAIVLTLIIGRWLFLKRVARYF
jgi:lipopolysaccharide export system permease protein